MQCHPATELESGIEMPVPCRTDQLGAFLDAENEYGSLFVFALVELITIKKRCLSMQTRY